MFVGKGDQSVRGGGTKVFVDKSRFAHMLGKTIFHLIIRENKRCNSFIEK